MPPNAFLFTALKIRSYPAGSKCKIDEHTMRLEENGDIHNQERFFFGLCPVSLRTSSSQGCSPNCFSELKVNIYIAFHSYFYCKQINLISADSNSKS